MTLAQLAAIGGWGFTAYGVYVVGYAPRPRTERHYYLNSIPSGFHKANPALFMLISAALTVLGFVLGARVLLVAFAPDAGPEALDHIIDKLAVPLMLMLVPAIFWQLRKTREETTQVASVTAEKTGQEAAKALGGEAFYKELDKRFDKIDASAAELGKHGKVLEKRQADLWNLANSVGRVARALCLETGVPVPPPLEKGSGMD